MKGMNSRLSRIFGVDTSVQMLCQLMLFGTHFRGMPEMTCNYMYNLQDVHGGVSGLIFNNK